MWKVGFRLNETAIVCKRAVSLKRDAAFQEKGMFRLSETILSVPRAQDARTPHPQPGRRSEMLSDTGKCVK